MPQMFIRLSGRTRCPDQDVALQTLRPGRNALSLQGTEVLLAADVGKKPVVQSAWCGYSVTAGDFTFLNGILRYIIEDETAS
jgi:hypothetical protein